MANYKVYTCNGWKTLQVKKAMQWHREGKPVTVSTYDDHDNPVKRVVVQGVPQKDRRAEDDHENRSTCKRIAKEVEAYANGSIRCCPECGEEFYFPDGVGDKYKCQHCGEVNDAEDFEQLGIYDYMQDVLDFDFTVNRYKEYRSCSVCVGWGGPNIYIDTATAYVKLYWGCSYAEYPISYDARDAIDEWAEEYYNCL